METDTEFTERGSTTITKVRSLTTIEKLTVKPGTEVTDSKPESELSLKDEEVHFDNFIPTNTTRKKSWLYDQYYFGEKDKEERRIGDGENHWTGAESIEWYRGQWVRNTMNGKGDYRWRYKGANHAFITYEGRFFANALHGYGVMSYPDGRMFKGLFYKNVRWGPGIVNHLTIKGFYADVGFWRKRQIVRLSWLPTVPPCTTADLTANSAWRNTVEPNRLMLSRNTREVGSPNPALELLKQNGANPVYANRMWSKVYSQQCTDLESMACDVAAFEREYYNGDIKYLQEVKHFTDFYTETASSNSESSTNLCYAWNNNPVMVHMMRHCYQHHYQSNSVGVNVTSILNGDRSQFKPPGKHERDCRSLLMASYLGYIQDVVKLVNEEGVDPGVTDAKGNSAITYATCGEQADIIHFLVDAGADVDSFNDSCCTALGIALVRLGCGNQEISCNAMLDVLLDKETAQPIPFITEWEIERCAPAKPAPVVAARKSKTNLAVAPTDKQKANYDSDEGISSENNLRYSAIKSEYNKTLYAVNEGPKFNVQYLYTVKNMAEYETKPEEKKKADIKGAKGEKGDKGDKGLPVAPHEGLLWHSANRFNYSTPLSSSEKLKLDRNTKLMLTVVQLISDGADPRVVRCPQPALFTIVVAEAAILVRYLTRCGLDINEKFPSAFNYTALDIAVSRPYTYENLNMIRELLLNGADATHRLPSEDIPDAEPGPTLLHVVLNKPRYTEYEEDIFRNIIDLLLSHGCSQTTLYKGTSPLDIVLPKQIALLDLFLRHPSNKINAIINSSNHTILAKFFSSAFLIASVDIDRKETLNVILSYCPDPLIECEDGDIKYKNLFSLAKSVLDTIRAKLPAGFDENASKKGLVTEKKISKSKLNRPPKPKEKEKAGAAYERLFYSYKDELNLVADYGRMLCIKRVQGKLMKGLIEVVVKLWISLERCLEIWDIFNNTSNPIYKDKQILRSMLCMIRYYNKTSYAYPMLPMITAAEKRTIDSEVGLVLRDHYQSKPRHLSSSSLKVEQSMKNLYLGRPDKKYDICFECLLPLEEATETPIICHFCSSVSFCNSSCLKRNMKRKDCHPCAYLWKQENYGLMEEGE